MKTIVSTLFALFCGLSVIAQDYAPDEMIIEYVAGTSEVDKQAVRNLYSITDYDQIDGTNGDIEFWYNIPLPLTLIEDGVTTVIQSIEALLINIEIQNGDETTVRANINDGDLNYILALLDEGTIHSDGTFDPLPFCDDVENDRLIGPVIEYPTIKGGADQPPVTIIIVDQRISNNNVNSIYSPNDQFLLNIQLGDEFISGGQHAHKVYSLIHNQLVQAGITNVNYYSLEVFNENGVGTTARLLKGLQELYNINREITTFQNAILNFSANMIIYDYDESSILLNYWNETITNQNMLLISSAGNQGMTSSNIFPASLDWANEISVAGTQSCFTTPWVFSNQNSTHFDIAVEADGILTHNGNNYELVAGTSYSSAFVTGAAAQLAARCSDFDPLEIRNQLLDYADQITELDQLVNNGRILNTAEAVNNWTACPPPPPVISEPKSFESNSKFIVSPNPFSQTASINIKLAEDKTAIVQLSNSMGQPIVKEQLTVNKGQETIEWETPNNLPKGMYLLQIHIGDNIQQQMLIKQ